MKRWIATWLVGCVSCGLAQIALGQSHVSGLPTVGEVGRHAGRLMVHGDHQFEIVFTDRSVEIFIFDQSGMPADAHRIRGSMMVSLPGERRTYRYDLYPPGRDAKLKNRLFLAVDLSRVPARGVTVTLALYGVDEQPIELAVPFQRTLSLEQIAIQRQRICPVSGKLLDSMGPPPQVNVGDRKVFVCCAGCQAPLRQNPELHLAKLAPPPPTKATGADARAIARQRTCPVMDEPLASMGGPWKLVVQGEPVFVCCKGCIRKVQERPEVYLAKITTSSASTLRK